MVNTLVIFLALFAPARIAIAQDYSFLVGTYKVEFEPMKIAGNLTGCVLNFKVLVLDYAYRKGEPVFLSGYIAYTVNSVKKNIRLGMKLGLEELLNRNAAPQAPFFAYIETPTGTTAKSKYEKFDAETHGYKLYLYQVDEQSAHVVRDIVKGKAVTLGFNRIEDGVDVLVPLDLTVESAYEEDGKLKQKRSAAILEQFGACFTETTKALKP